MKITVGISPMDDYGSRGLDVNIVTTESEQKTLLEHHIYLPSAGYSVRDLMRQCFDSQGAFYREVGISNYRSFQPDWTYFNRDSAGWVRFLRVIETSEDRDAILKRIAVLVSNRIKLLVTPSKKVSVVDSLEQPVQSTAQLELVDLTGKTIQFKVGTKVYQAIQVEEMASETAMLTNAKREIQTAANTQVKSFEAEYGNNLVMMQKQYEKDMATMKSQMEKMIPCPQIDIWMAQHGVIFTVENTYYRFFIPFKLNIKYVATYYRVWELKEEWQIDNKKCMLEVVVDKNLKFRRCRILSDKFEDTVSQFHYAGGTLCFGSFQFSMKTIHDIIKIRDELQVMYQTINMESLGSHNMRDRTKESKLNDYLCDAPTERFKWKDPETGETETVDDYDYDDIAKIVKTKEEGGTIWTT